MTRSDWLPVALLVDEAGIVVGATAGISRWLEAPPAEPRLRLRRAPSTSGGADAWLEDEVGERLAVAVDEAPLGDGRTLMILRTPGDEARFSPLFRALLHDLRSPVATAHLLCQTLALELEAQGGAAADLGRSYLTRLQQELRRVSVMITLCRGLGTPAGRVHRPCDLGQLVQAVVSRHQRSLERDGILLRMRPGPEVLVTADAEGLQAVVGSILLVMAELSPGGWVELSWGIADGEGQLWVTASGAGGLDLAAMLTEQAPEPQRASWLEVGLLTARWVAERDGVGLRPRTEGRPANGVAVCLGPAVGG